MNNIDFDPVWEEKYFKNSNYRSYYPYDIVVSFVLNNLNKKREISQIKVLEVGCGTGNNLWFVAREGMQAFGIDGSETAIQFSKDRFESEGLVANFVVGDMANLPYEDEYFDLVFDRSSMSFLSKKGMNRAVMEVNRVLKSNGMFLCTPYSSFDSSCYINDDQDGVIKDIVTGRILGGSQVAFYGIQELRSMFSNKWNIQEIIHVERQDVSRASREISAEWNIVATKV